MFEVIRTGSFVTYSYVLVACSVEKERDAYSAAYEASLEHFERWSKSASKGGGTKS
jgi:hypothetical protein